MLRIVTWNINSVRIRIDGLKRLVAATNPDIVCLQETRVTDDLFPRAAVAGLGFGYHCLHGIKAHNGVAILSRQAPDPLPGLTLCGRADGRHVAAAFGGIELHNFYVPAGGDVPDPAVNPRFAHKLDFLDAMTAWSHGLRDDTPAIVLGDLNVAPLEHDVWSHKQLLKVVSHTPAETGRLAALQESRGWIDSCRQFVPETEKLYSWWSYRARDWRKSNRGRRLDHIWVSPALRPALRHAWILKEARDWPGGSDHVPVIADLARCPGPVSGLT